MLDFFFLLAIFPCWAYPKPSKADPGFALPIICITTEKIHIYMDNINLRNQSKLIKHEPKVDHLRRDSHGDMQNIGLINLW